MQKTNNQIQSKRLVVSSEINNQKSSDVYQQQIDELKSEIIQNNSLLNKIESLLSNNSENINQHSSQTNIQNAAAPNVNNKASSIVPLNNDYAIVNRNLLANQIRIPNNILNMNANSLVNNPYLLMNNNINNSNNLNEFHQNMNSMQINAANNPLGFLFNNNNFSSAAAGVYQNPYIANRNNFNPTLNNQFLGLTSF